MTPPRCDACRFWFRAKYSGDEGECRRRAPYAAPTRDRSRWMKTDPDDWCGEYEAKLLANPERAC